MHIHSSWVEYDEKTRLAINQADEVSNSGKEFTRDWCGWFVFAAQTEATRGRSRIVVQIILFVAISQGMTRSLKRRQIWWKRSKGETEKIHGANGSQFGLTVNPQGCSARRGTEVGPRHGANVRGHLLKTRYE